MKRIFSLLLALILVVNLLPVMALATEASQHEITKCSWEFQIAFEEDGQKHYHQYFINNYISGACRFGYTDLQPYSTFGGDPIIIDGKEYWGSSGSKVSFAQITVDGNLVTVDLGADNEKVVLERVAADQFAVKEVSDTLFAWEPELKAGDLFQWDHLYTRVSCDQPKTCSCGAVTDEVAGHYWEDKNADPRVCVECGAQESQTSHTHALKFVEEVGPTCISPGEKAHYRCTECGQMFADENAQQEVHLEDLMIAGISHKLIFVAGTEATCTKAGRVDHYLCESCGNAYKDDHADLVLWDLTIPRPDHQIVNGACTMCQRSYIAYGTQDDTYWDLTTDGTLTVEGSDVNGTPWEAYAEQVTKIVLNASSMWLSSEEELPPAAYPNLTSLELGKDSIFINPYQQFNAPKLEAFVVDPENTAFFVRDGLLLRTYSAEEGGLAAYPAARTEAEFHVPEYVSTIENCAFHQAQELEKIHIHANTIRVGAFDKCSALTDVYIYTDANFLESDSLEAAKNMFGDPARVTIHGIPGSMAQTVADTYGYAFAQLEEAPAEPSALGLKSLTLSVSKITAPGEVEVVMEVTGGEGEERFGNVQLACKENEKTQNIYLTNGDYNPQTGEFIPNSDGKLRGTLVLDEYMDTSSYFVVWLDVSDGSGNYVAYYEGANNASPNEKELPEDVKAMRLEVTGTDTPDNQAPEVTKLEIAASVAIPGSEIPFTVEASDDLSGVLGIYVDFWNPETHMAFSCHATRYYLDETTNQVVEYPDGKLHGNVTVPQDLPTGSYLLINVSAEDVAGNWSYYDFYNADTQLPAALESLRGMKLEVVTQLPAVTYGDANGDGAVNAKDAMLVLQYYTKKLEADKLDLTACDVDGNGTVNAKDAMLILQKYTKKLTAFPVEAK